MSCFQLETMNSLALLLTLIVLLHVLIPNINRFQPDLRVRVMVFIATFNNISVKSWMSVLLLQETGIRTHFVSGDMIGLGICCLSPPSTIFQLYRGGQFYWWRKPEDPEKTTDLPRIRQTLLHNVVSNTPRHEWDYTNNASGYRHQLHRQL